jgi:hypothetical protein
VDQPTSRSRGGCTELVNQECLKSLDRFRTRCCIRPRRASKGGARNRCDSIRVHLRTSRYRWARSNQTGMAGGRGRLPALFGSTL